MQNVFKPLQVKSSKIIDSSQNYLADFAKSINHTSFNLELPVVDYDIEEGERVLFILSHPSEEDVKAKRLGKSSQGLLIKNLVEQLYKENQIGLRHNLPYIKSVSLINFRDKAGEKMMGVGSDFETDYSKVWVDRINAYVNDYQPTRILISGEQAFQAILYHSQVQIPNHQELDRVEYTEAYLQVGRVFDFQYDGITVPTSFTLPFHWTSTSNPAYIEEAPTMIHQQKFHLEYLLYGRNLYQVTDRSSWSRVDVLDMDTFLEFYDKLLQAKKVAIDLETDNLSRFANKILTIHFSLDGQTAYNLPICHRETPFTADEIEYIQSKIKDYLQDGTTIEHVYHNAKFDLGVLWAQLGLEFYNHKIFDTQGGIYCFHPDTLVETNRGLYTLDKLTSMNTDDVLVKSYNHNSNSIEFKPILNKLKLTNTKALIRIDYEDGSLQVTEDHQIWSVTRQRYIKAKDLLEGEEILSSEL